jgi:hypothetical protein
VTRYRQLLILPGHQTSALRPAVVGEGYERRLNRQPFQMHTTGMSMGVIATMLYLSSV